MIFVKLKQQLQIIYSVVIRTSVSSEIDFFTSRNLTIRHLRLFITSHNSIYAVDLPYK